MAVVMVSGMAVAVLWCLVAFAIAAVIGRAFARSEHGEPWYVGSPAEQPALLVQTGCAFGDERPARRPVTY